MFCKRNDGLGRVFLPFHIPAVILAVLCTLWSGVPGWAVPLMLIGSWLGWFIVLVAVYLLGVLLMSLTVNMKAPPPMENHPVYRRTVIFVIGLLCRFARVRIRFTGEEKLPQGRFLLVSNHRSNYDPITALWAMRARDIAFVTKPENLRIPLAGPMIYKANFLPIDREDPRRAMTTIQTAAELIKNDVVSIGVYPEGTRSKEGELLPFHNGVFKIAQKAAVPVVVLSTEGTENIHKNFPLRHTDVTLRVCAVLPAGDVRESSTAALSAQVRGLLERELSPREPAAV